MMVKYTGFRAQAETGIPDMLTASEKTQFHTDVKTESAFQLIQCFREYWAATGYLVAPEPWCSVSVAHSQSGNDSSATTQ